MHSNIRIKRTKVLEKDTVDLYAHMLQLSPEGMRYYEQKGIMYPKRDAETGYRIYGGGESISAITCKKYGRYGMSIDTISNILKQTDVETVLDTMYNQRIALEEEIIEKQKRLHSLQKKIIQLQAENSQRGRYSIVMRPAMYWIKSRENRLILESKKDIARTRKWNGFSPYTDTVIVWSQNRLLTGEGSIMAGHIIEESDAAGLNIGDAYYLPATKCLYSVNEIPEYIQMSTSVFDEMLAYMREHHLAARGDGVARQIRMYIDQEKEYHFVSELWIPID